MTANPSTAGHAGAAVNRKSSGLEPVCPRGTDPADLVTVRELGIIGRQLGADPLGAIENGTELRWEALARLGWVLDRRRDPKAAVDTWLDLPLAELLELLGLDDELEPDEGPTAPAPGPA